ncbi:ImmA/IrrE family metallo-endopeptidase [Xylophilus rhododendri]|uniref:ImmA/IrrE family metallo-endopeptidase n=1 Tax=Xylophilus rhododendri TaxID=2697032 RepID=A0A857J8W8_9BURK|nr:ImmA/IrrE family metallo-endopeptidase [Xylophilus rhododendri]QHJ00425.1 ImmA/IrrE family metallo-endopeptidase [Xylophilus rhododendri]
MELQSAYRQASPPCAISHSPAQAAQILLTRHWDKRFPVNVAAIIAAEGLNLVCRGILNDEGYGFSGYYNRAARTVEYNGNEAHVRQRFTMAHELGHYALGHSDAPRDTASSFVSDSTKPQERAANQFAAALLMPAAAVKVVIQAGTVKTSDELARIFGVSKVAMAYRVQNLGIAV